MADHFDDQILPEGAFTAATIAHIERVLVQENVHLRHEVSNLRIRVRELEQTLQARDSQAATLIRLRQALAAVSWATTLEDAVSAADAGLRYEDLPEQPADTSGPPDAP